MSFLDFKKVDIDIIGIYSIRNTITNKVYIGDSIHCYKRIYQEHYARLKGNKHINPQLQEDFNRYGEGAFVCNIIEVVENHKYLQSREWFHRDNEDQALLYNKVNKFTEINLSCDDFYKFWRSVDIKGHNECWNWRGRIFGNYGRFDMNRKELLVHRVAYYFQHDRFDLSMSVCHKCDNPICVNPNHLFLDSHCGNMYDKSLKSRGNCKINHDIANEIRNLNKNGFLDREILETITKKYNLEMSINVVSNVVNNINYAVNGSLPQKRHAQLTWEIVNKIRELGLGYSSFTELTIIVNNLYNIKTSSKSVSQVIKNQIWYDEKYSVPSHKVNPSCRKNIKKPGELYKTIPPSKRVARGKHL